MGTYCYVVGGRCEALQCPQGGEGRGHIVTAPTQLVVSFLLQCLDTVVWATGRASGL